MVIFLRDTVNSYISTNVRLGNSGQFENAVPVVIHDEVKPLRIRRIGQIGNEIDYCIECDWNGVIKYFTVNNNDLDRNFSGWKKLPVF